MKPEETFAPDPFDFAQPQGKEVPLASFQAFVKAVNAHSHRHGIAWRGQADAKWRLTSSAFNAERFRVPLYEAVTHHCGRSKNILELSRAVEERIKDSGRGVQKALGTDPHLRILFQDELTDRDIHTPERTEGYNELLSICQHFGMKTPLLDMTDSPYVALYFAAYDALVHQDHGWRGQNRLAVWQIPTYYWNPIQERTIFDYEMVPGESSVEIARNQAKLKADTRGWPSRESMKVNVSNVFPRVYRNDRLIAQQGSFVRVTPDLPLDHIISMIQIPLAGGSYEPLSDRLVRYTLPARFALDYLVQLRKMNVRHETLFPDLVGQMNEINLAMDHYDYAGQGDKLDRGSMFDGNDRRKDFWV